MEQPLVSVITPTWERPELLAETIRHLREQDYPNLEHIVVSDGPDPSVGRATGARQLSSYAAVSYSGPIDLRVYELGRNFTVEGPSNSFGIGALTAGMLLARGELLLHWCDDERALVPDHISRLVALLGETAADFVYPRVRIWRNGDPDGPETTIIGTDPPRHGQITHFLYRASLLRTAMPAWGTHPVDWSLVRDWMAAGASWAMLPECTFQHRLDQ